MKSNYGHSLDTLRDTNAMGYTSLRPVLHCLSQWVKNGAAWGVKHGNKTQISRNPGAVSQQQIYYPTATLPLHCSAGCTSGGCLLLGGSSGGGVSSFARFGSGGASSTSLVFASDSLRVRRWEWRDPDTARTKTHQLRVQVH